MADIETEVRAGYQFSSPALELGALTVDGTPVPSAKVRLPLAMTNRHGLVAGATGTGKTKTLQMLAEQLSEAGVPVFLADIKGDLSGMAQPGTASDQLTRRAAQIGQDWQPAGYPVQFYALGGHGNGIPVRATMTGFGPILLAKVLGLNQTQESSLNLVFHFADKQGLPLLDLKDLQAVITYLMSDQGKDALAELGGLSRQTAGVLLRDLTAFSDAGADDFFGEPQFDTHDLLQVRADGRGTVSIMELPDVAAQPALFSSFLMWLLADLFHDLPEVGDLAKPKLVFFLDEAHLLFKDASKDFLTSITQTVRLIRSKGVGVFFVTQTPKDVHPDVLAQLGNRIQHALRAYTPEDAKGLRATASTFPVSAYNLEQVLPGLGIGEAVVTVLSEHGVPTPVALTTLNAPRSLMAAADAAAVQSVVQGSPLYAKYAHPVDRESAYELLASRTATTTATNTAAPTATNTAAAPPAGRGRPGGAATPAAARRPEPNTAEKLLESPATRQLVRSATAVAGASIARSLFGTARRRRRR